MSHFYIDVTYAIDTEQLEHLALDSVDGRFFESEVIYHFKANFQFKNIKK